MILRQIKVFLLIEGFYYLGHCILIQHHGGEFSVGYRYYSFKNILLDHGVDDMEVRRESVPGRGGEAFL